MLARAEQLGDLRRAFRVRPLTWRLAGDPTGATCERTSAPADLTLSVRELGRAYLGGPTLTSMADAGLVDGAPATVAAAGLAFSGERSPWCPEVF